jgi:hypothetical protein
MMMFWNSVPHQYERRHNVIKTNAFVNRLILFELHRDFTLAVSAACLLLGGRRPRFSFSSSSSSSSSLHAVFVSFWQSSDFFRAARPAAPRYAWQLR